MWQTDTLTHSCEHDIRTYGRKNTDTQTHMEDIVRMNVTDRQVYWHTDTKKEDRKTCAWQGVTDRLTDM